MDAQLDELFDWQVPSGGMFVWATARDASMNTDHLLREALFQGVCATPSSVFDPEGQNRKSIRINFTLNDPDKLAEGIRRLAVAARATLAKPK